MNCLDLICPKCGNQDITKIKNRNARNWGKVSEVQCDCCGETFGGPTEDNPKYQKNYIDRLRRD